MYCNVCFAQFSKESSFKVVIVISQSIPRSGVSSHQIISVTNQNNVRDC
jgi:hypothetical protein